MGNLPNWAVGSSIIVLILLGPIIAFFVVIAAEMLTDVLTKEGMTAVCIVAAGAIGWRLFRHTGRSPIDLSWGQKKSDSPARCSGVWVTGWHLAG
jgi:hypothetical protein